MGPWKRAGMGVGLVHIPPRGPTTFDSGSLEKFFLAIERVASSCFRRLRIWKQKILQKEIHELLQRDDGAPERIRTADPQILVGCGTALIPINTFLQTERIWSPW